MEGRQIIRRASFQPKQKNKEKWHYSNFLITINTNVKPKTEEEFNEVQEAFEDFLTWLFHKEHADERLFKFINLPSRGIKGKKSDFPEKFKRIDSETVIELGQSRRGGRIHSHTLLEVTHKSGIQIDAELIKKEAEEHLGDLVKGVYVNVKFINGTAKTILSYIRKGQPVTADDLTEAFNTLQL